MNFFFVVVVFLYFYPHAGSFTSSGVSTLKDLSSTSELLLHNQMQSEQQKPDCPPPPPRSSPSFSFSPVSFPHSLPHSLTRSLSHPARSSASPVQACSGLSTPPRRCKRLNRNTRNRSDLPKQASENSRPTAASALCNAVRRTRASHRAKCAPTRFHSGPGQG